MRNFILLVNLLFSILFFSCLNEKKTEQKSNTLGEKNLEKNELESNPNRISKRSEKIVKNTEVIAKPESYNETVLRMVDEYLSSSNESFFVDTLNEIFKKEVDLINQNQLQTLIDIDELTFNDLFVDSIGKLYALNQYSQVCIKDLSQNGNYFTGIVFSKNEGGHYSDQVELLSVDSTHQKIFKLPLFYKFGRDGYSALVESKILDGKIFRTLTEEIGWPASKANGYSIIPKSVTVQTFEIVNDGSLVLIDEQTTKHDFEEFIKMHSDKEVECNVWNNNYVKIEDEEDTLGWFRNHEDYWIDTTRGNEFKYNFWPPLHEEKYYYSNFTIYLHFDLESVLENPRNKLKVMVKDSAQNLVKWLYPLDDSKFIDGKSVANSKVLERGNRNVVLMTDFGILTYNCYQVGDLLCVNISNDNEGEVIIYNLLGEVVYNKVGLRPSSMLSVSKDSRFVSFQSGGIHTEDGMIHPVQVIVYDLHLKKYVLNTQSKNECFSSGIFTDSDWFTLVVENCMPQKATDIFLVNLADDTIHKLNLDNVSRFRMKTCPDFELTAVGKDIIKQVYLDRDFTTIHAWPF